MQGLFLDLPFSEMQQEAVMNTKDMLFCSTEGTAEIDMSVTLMLEFTREETYGTYLCNRTP